MYLVFGKELLKWTLIFGSKGPSSCQNQGGPFTASECQFGNRTRRFTKEHFTE